MSRGLGDVYKRQVHGGASMEEVAVPIIEITQKASNIEAFIVDESRVLTLGAKEYAIIKIYDYDKVRLIVKKMTD